MDPATINVLLAAGFGVAWLISCAAHAAKGERKRRIRIVPTAASIAMISAVLGFAHQNVGLQTLYEDSKGKVVILEEQAEQLKATLLKTVAKLEAEDKATTQPADCEKTDCKDCDKCKTTGDQTLAPMVVTPAPKK